METLLQVTVGAEETAFCDCGSQSTLVGNFGGQETTLVNCGASAKSALRDCGRPGKVSEVVWGS